MISRILSRKQINQVLIFVLTLFIMLSLTIHHTNNNYNKNEVNLHSVLKTNKGDSKDVDCSFVRSIQGPNRSRILDKLDEQYDLGFLVSGVEHHIARRPLFNCLDADDPYLTNAIRTEVMNPPVKRVVYDQDPNQVEFHEHQSLDLMEMVYKNRLHNGGFFIEAGAGDCDSSITWTLEDKFNWTGLLVEAVPSFYQNCKKKKRDAWLVNSCLATMNIPHYSFFNLKSVGTFGLPGRPGLAVDAMQGFSGSDYLDKSVELQCLPVYSLLMALGNPTVHFFVLDIEGFELAVLRTIPFNKVDIEVFSIETDLAGKFQKDSSRDKIIEIMTQNGYTRFDHRKNFNHLTNATQNDLFVRNDIVKKLNVVQLL